MILPHEVPKAVKMIESRKVVTKDWREGGREIVFNACRVSVLHDEYVLAVCSPTM